MKIINDALIEVTNNDIKAGTIKIPDNIKVIEENAFKECTNIIGINIPSNVKSIKYRAFYKCCNLENIILSDGVTEIYPEAFACCISLKNVTLPNTVKQIGRAAFYDCISLKKIVIPDSVKEISNSTFDYCISLKDVTLPKNLNSIHERAFFKCKNLKKISIPNSVTCIRETAFYECPIKLKLTTSLINFNCSEFFHKYLTNSINIDDVFKTKSIIIGKKLILNGLKFEEVRKKEIMSQIKKALKTKGVNNNYKEFFKYKNHEYFIKMMLDELNSLRMYVDFKQKLDDYINGFIKNKNLKIENDVENSKINQEENLITYEEELKENIELENQEKTNDINVILKKLSELPKEDVFIIMDMVKNNLFDEKIMDYINMSKEEKLKVLESESQPIYKVKLEKEPIEEYKAKQKVKR